MVVGVSKFGIASAFNMNYISFMSLIPTVFVATVFGYANIMSRGVTILAPQVAELKGVWPNLITALFAAVAAVSSLLIVQNLPKFY